ncbi:MAG: SDR family oxidoreductase, partial [Planctomycetaceae bacterium]|nr:SDR family oxidoreductase [Planctomycetaceae bacterium]
TALITGASGGLGEAFAKILAARTRVLVLAARSGDKLNRLAARLSEAHGIRVEVVPVDLSVGTGTEQLLDFLKARSLQVDVLINNAGFGVFGPLADADLQEQLAQIQVNVVALTHLTRELLPGMVRRGRGQILNVASTAAFQAGPWMAVYYATKAYVLSFSEALRNELEGTGVTVTCLCPGPTRTGFMARARMGDPAVLAKSPVMMDADEVARRGLEGLRKGRRLVIPGLLNKMLAHATRLGSRGLSARVVRRMMKSIEATGSAR